MITKGHRIVTLSINILVILILTRFASCRSFKIDSSVQNYDWKQKAVKSFNYDTSIDSFIEPVIIDSLGNGLFKGYSNKKKNKGEVEYVIKYGSKVSQLEYRRLVRVFNYRFAHRKLEKYLSDEQLDEMTKLLTLRVNF